MKRTTKLLNLILLCTLPLLFSACGGGSSSSSKDSGSTETFTIQVKAIPSAGGAVSGAGTYEKDSTLSLQAIPNDGYRFVRWEEDGAPISNQADLSTKVTKDKVFTALFSDIEEIKVSPVNAKIPQGRDLKLSAVAVYIDGSSKDVTDSVIWFSSNDELAVFDGNDAGALTGKAEGALQIAAIIGPVTSVTAVTVISPDLLELTLSKDSIELAQGETDFIRAIGHYSDDVVIDVTDSVIWASANDSVSSIGSEGSNAGVITGGVSSTTEVTASFDGQSASATVTVNPASLSSVSISPASANVLQSGLIELAASASYSDSTSKDVTAQGVWQSSAPEVAAVSNLSPTKGLVSALSVGSATISVQVGEQTAASVIEVGAALDEPGSLALRAIPNVILSGGTDKSKITATVVSNDKENSAIADGRLVKFVESSGSLTLDSDQGRTVSEKVVREASGLTPGQYELIASVPETIAIDQVTIRVVSSFSDVLGPFYLSITPDGDGYFQQGDLFVASITNTSNRPFNLHGATLFNGPSQVASFVPSDLGVDVLGRSETSTIGYKLETKMKDDGFRMVFDLSDTPTGSEFTKEVLF